MERLRTIMIRMTGRLSGPLMAAALCFATARAGAEPPAPPLATEDPLGGSGSGRVEYNDYFLKDQNEALRVLLDDVELYHIGPDNFWKSWRLGAYEYAKSDLLYALRKFPNHPRALHMLGEVAKVTKDYGLPIVYFEKAIKLFPSYAYTHAQYGQYLVEIGAVNAGITELEAALRLDPHLSIARAWLDLATAQSNGARRATTAP